MSAAGADRGDGGGVTSKRGHACCGKSFNKAFPGCTLGVMISSESITHPESNNMCLMNKTA